MLKLNSLLIVIVSVILFSCTEKQVSNSYVTQINGKKVLYNDEKQVVGWDDYLYTEWVIKRNTLADMNPLLYIERAKTRYDYTYQTNGELDKIIYSPDYTQSANYATFFKWRTEGDLFSLEGDQIGVSRSGYLKTEFKYCTKEYSLGNVDIPLLLATQEYLAGYGPGLINVFDQNAGKRSKHLLLEKTQTDADGKYDATTKYRYVFDDEDRIKEVYGTIKYVMEAEARAEELYYRFEY